MVYIIAEVGSIITNHEEIEGIGPLCVAKGYLPFVGRIW